MIDQSASSRHSGQILAGGVIEAMRGGAYDYLLKPFDVELVRSSVRRAVERQLLVAQRRAHESELKRRARQLQQANEALKESQAQLIQSERLAYLGQLAAGVAHEINNPLAFVMSNLETLAAYSTVVRKLLTLYEQLSASVRHPGQGEDQGRILSAIADLCEGENITFLLDDTETALAECADGTARVSDIVEALRGFTGIDGQEIRPADVNACLETTLKLLPTSLKQTCDLEVTKGEIQDIRCRPAQLNQLFANLIVNAIQATGVGGKVTVDTEWAEDAVVVRITDDGPGIAAELQDGLFTPFFTTRAPGEGVGLGLYIAYRIVQEHNGMIEVESRPGEGAAVTVTLPMRGPEREVGRRRE